MNSQSDKFKGKSITAEQKYIGIQNMGATCYMNSVIQTLFMTPEFRDHIFSQKIDIERIKQIDKSIPVQIQKLFASLQLKKEKKISTQDLIKSFGWTSSEAFQQHDSQEFIRILFEAIDNTFKGNFINDLYQGSTVNYVKCLNCENESLREEQFLDIQLTIKNDFENIKNESIEEAFVNLMRPEMLLKDNQYFCEQCNSKQDAQRGCRLAKIPQIFTIQLNRFTYDYMMDRRVKLNSLFKFPYVLNMNQFASGFSGIPEEIKHMFEDKKTKAQREQEELQKKKEEEQANKQEMKNPNEKQKQPTASEQTQPKEQKSKGNLKEFLKNERLKNKKEKSEKEEVEIELFTDEVKGEKYVLEVNEVNSNQEQPFSRPPPPPPSSVLQSLIQQSDIPAPPPINILDSNLSGNQQQNANIPKAPPLIISKQQVNVQQHQATEEEKQAQEKKLQEYIAYLNESYEPYWSECQQQLQQYLKDGDNVYELFSICMHSGGAYGGHYYGYIKSFEDNYWYKFNDSSVTYMELEEVLKKSYGGSDFNNGYMLFYRKHNPHKEYSFNEESIPQYLKGILEQEEKLKAEANKVITLKYDIDQKLKSQQNNTPEQNLNSSSSTLDTTTNETQNNTPLFVCLSNEHNLKVEDLSCNLEILKIDNVNYSLSIEGLQKHLCLQLNAPDFKRVLIFRKIVSEEQILGQLLNIQSSKSLTELGITKDEVLFVEIQEQEVAVQYKWVNRFEEISSTIFIRYNTPTDEEELQTVFNNLIKIDSRKSEQYLKQVMCDELKLDQNRIILRFDGPMGREIKNINSLIKDNHAYNRKVYLQYGLPCDSNQFRNKLYIAQPQSLYESNIFFLFEELSDIITNRDWSLEQLKESIREILRAKDISQYTQLFQDFEVREKYQFKMRRLYKKGLLSEQFVSDKTEFAIEFKEDSIQELELDQFKLYVRVLDSQNSTLKSRFEIIVNQEDTLERLAENIFSHDQTVNVNEMSVILIKDVETFQLSDLMSEEWIQLSEKQETITKPPLKISNDGQLLIIKEHNLNLAQFDLSSFKDMRIQNQRQEKAQKTRMNKIYHPKEKALKINYQQEEIEVEHVEEEERTNDD